MWIEKLENGKYKFFERYKDPYTEKWRYVFCHKNTKVLNLCPLFAP